MAIRKKKATKRRNPYTCSTRMKRNPEDWKKLESVVKEVEVHVAEASRALFNAKNILEKNAQTSERITKLANEGNNIFWKLADFEMGLMAYLQHFHDERKYS